MLKDKLKAVGTLQQEMLAKSKALLEAKEKWTAEQKRLEATIAETLPSARDRTIADLKAKIAQQDKIIDGIKAQKESVAAKLSMAYVPIEEHKRIVKELEKVVEDLKTRLSMYQKQLQNQETTLSAVKAQIGTSVASRVLFLRFAILISCSILFPP